jgi:uncharacterized protein (TIGR03084 family)
MTNRFAAPVSMDQLAADLAAETQEFTRRLDALGEPAWRTPTPAPGWTVADQVSHLAYFDEAAVRAATDAAAFDAQDRARLTGADDVARRYRGYSPVRLRDWFAGARRSLVAVYADLDPRARVPWFGPSMSAASMLTARLMETWAHGQDIADALGAERQPTDRLRHVAHIGVAARPFSFANRGRPVPQEPVRVELTAPGGAVWAWGPAGATDRVTGTALDFCLVVTQRRHRADTGLVASGPAAEGWIAIAQAFAGPPGPGRTPGQFR